MPRRPRCVFSSGVSIAGIAPSPTRLKWPSTTAPGRPLMTGTSTSSAASAVRGMSTWSLPAPSAEYPVRAALRLYERRIRWSSGKFVGARDDRQIIYLCKTPAPLGAGLFVCRVFRSRKSRSRLCECVTLAGRAKTPRRLCRRDLLLLKPCKGAILASETAGIRRRSLSNY